MSAPARIQSFLSSTAPLRRRVASHDVYDCLKTLEQARLFMEHHIYAVWDFMSLVKSLQGLLTCTQVPWIPQGDPVGRRLINEIILDEESDEDGAGGYASHFELYLDAMEQCGADASRIKSFVDRLRRGEEVLAALDSTGAPPASRRFVAHTWRIITSKSPHRIAAAFAIGREEIVPEMFQAALKNIQRRTPGRFSRFGDYLARHIHVDKKRHGPMASRMLEALCGDDEAKWREALSAAQSSLVARVELWDEVKSTLLARGPKRGRRDASPAASAAKQGAMNSPKPRTITEWIGIFQWEEYGSRGADARQGRLMARFNDFLARDGELPAKVGKRTRLVAAPIGELKAPHLRRFLKQFLPQEAPEEQDAQWHGHTMAKFIRWLYANGAVTATKRRELLEALSGIDMEH